MAESAVRNRAAGLKSKASQNVETISEREHFLIEG
jgi:hypothetical protein